MSAYDEGMRMRRRVLGDEHVDRASAVTPLNEDFDRWITERAWGEVWTRPGLDLRTRSLVTISLMAALGHHELELHMKAARNTGATVDDIKEALFHVALYAGIPAAGRGFRMAKKIYEGDDQ